MPLALRRVAFRVPEVHHWIEPPRQAVRQALRRAQQFWVPVVRARELRTAPGRVELQSLPTALSPRRSSKAVRSIPRTLASAASQQCRVPRGCHWQMEPTAVRERSVTLGHARMAASLTRPITRLAQLTPIVPATCASRLRRRSLGWPHLMALVAVRERDAFRAAVRRVAASTRGSTQVVHPIRPMRANHANRHSQVRTGQTHLAPCVV